MIAQGAEAVISRTAAGVMKERVSKGYRIPELDTSLRQFRTRREAKILQRLEELNFPAPHLQEFSDQRMSIVMDFVDGKKVKDVLQDNLQLAPEIGEKIAQLHQANIVHGDLTTSNMILEEKTQQVHFIDFGLSMFSEKVEDKAVDLFLLDRALASTHTELYPKVFEHVLEGYKQHGAEEVLQRLDKVKKRGRNKK